MVLADSRNRREKPPTTRNTRAWAPLGLVKTANAHARPIYHRHCKFFIVCSRLSIACISTCTVAYIMLSEMVLESDSLRCCAAHARATLVYIATLGQDKISVGLCS